MFAMKQPLDSKSSIMLAKPDVEMIKSARRFLRGAAVLLDCASNGDPFIERLAGESSVLANMAEVALFGQDCTYSDVRTNEYHERAVNVISMHWITEMRCDHEADTPYCACGWTGDPQKSVGDAAKMWAIHLYSCL